jgi:phosphopentomutase
MVIDGCGAGAAPDANAYGDSEVCNTLGNLGRQVGPLNLPHFAQLGLGNITEIAGVPSNDNPIGLFGKLKEQSNGKDTQTGHWELMGIISEHVFPTYPEGFPPEIIDRFIAETGCQSILCNKPASGTEVLERLGPEHQKTGFPIVYTSGDSVFQIACHVDVVPLETLYKWCEIARRMLTGKDRVGRVIARPFIGEKGSYMRLQGDRRDYAVPPPDKTLLDELRSIGMGVFGVGKIEDIFVKRGLSHAKHTATNAEGLRITLAAIRHQIDLEPLAIIDDPPLDAQLIFTNLVDTDSLFGHRRDPEGYAKALAEIDYWLSKMLASLTEGDLLIIASDHGNDPTATGTDHTREYVPLLLYSPAFIDDATASSTGKRELGVRNSFADVAATVAGWFGFPWSGAGVSCLKHNPLVGNY